MIPLSALETATGIVLGGSSEPKRPLPTAPAGHNARAALEEACLPALRRPPCVVSFSGGRDSSLVLAAAASAARREGLPPPIPYTNRFPGAPHTDEAVWQERVVSHLGLDDWRRLELADELDVVGPLATRGLQRHGLLWPFNVHFHVPPLESAVGGTLLTGIGGDELFGQSRWAAAQSAFRDRPGPRSAARLALLTAPAALRAALVRRRSPEPFPWLTRDAARGFLRAWAAEQAREPRGLERRLRELPGRRAMRVGRRSLDLLAADAGATIEHPLLHPHVLAAVAAEGGRYGWTDRTAAMRALFDGLLPREVLGRTSKARFEGAFWGRRSREFAAGWRGEAADPAVVDLHRLREVWSEDEPDAHSYLLLQAAWLERARSGQLDQRPVRRVHPRASLKFPVNPELEKAR